MSSGPPDAVVKEVARSAARRKKSEANKAAWAANRGKKSDEPAVEPVAAPVVDARYAGMSVEAVAELRALPLLEVLACYNRMEDGWKAAGKPMALMVRALCLADLFYLLTMVCRRKDMLHPWVFARVREVEANPDNRIDLWARGHFKSSTITFGLTIQDILRNPEVTFGIFSHTRPIAKAFLRQIMREFEGNRVLHAAFPDVLWGMDTRSAPKWSEDDGIIVRRKSNPPEATIEAWGLVDGQPTSKHFQVLLYDDIVVEGSVTTPEMIEKTMKSLEQSYNLANESFVRRFAGTRWHFNDAYSTLKARGTAVAREYPGTVDGTDSGDPVFWSAELMAEKRRDMGPYTFAAQILLNPKADTMQGFRREWLRHFKEVRENYLNWYIVVDAASSKKRGSDFTAMWAVGLGMDQNYYCVPICRDRLNLKERGDRLFAAHRKYRPLQVRYERYGMMSDIEHYQARMEAENYRFTITEVAGQTSKADRIKRLLPMFEQGRIWLPESLHVTDWQRTPVDLVRAFVEEEYMAFPVGLHEDMLDSLARIAEPDLPLIWPRKAVPQATAASVMPSVPAYAT